MVIEDICKCLKLVSGFCLCPRRLFRWVISGVISGVIFGAIFSVIFDPLDRQIHL